MHFGVIASKTNLLTTNMPYDGSNIANKIQQEVGGI